MPTHAIMKKIIATLLLFAATVAIADAASGQIIRTGASHNSHNHNSYRNYNRPSHVHYSHGHSRPNHYSHHYPRHYSYRYDRPVFYAPYYSLSPYSYYNRGYYGYGYGYPGISVNYTTYADPDAPGYAVGGAVAGGVLGAIIGNNSRGHHGRNSWVEAAIGSTIGYLAGSAADNAAVREQRAAAAAAAAANRSGTAVREPDYNTGFDAHPYSPQQPQQPQHQQSQQSQQHTQTTPAAKYNYNQSPMSQANALFGRQ
ncbi:MAG: hypothetical protein LBM04_02775 [Opitutaceae bacterium]|jgi:hypothetical protein|nr:hypothetical protein [Opitutaceae bacterium]